MKNIQAKWLQTIFVPYLYIKYGKKIQNLSKKNSCMAQDSMIDSFSGLINQIFNCEIFNINKIIIIKDKF